MTKFGILDSDGGFREIPGPTQDDMRRCPHFIMTPEHYREDGSCRCNDIHHEIMSTWGYVWNERALRWDTPEDDDE